MNVPALSPRQPLRLATRASRLALWQAEHVASLIRTRFPHLAVELLPLSTVADERQADPLRALGTQGVFTREIQAAVLDGAADVAVHSLKDLPTEKVPGIELAGIPLRGPRHDALVLPQHVHRAADDLASTEASPRRSAFDLLEPGARIGTGSLRRKAQFLHRRPDLQFAECRGNVETRLRKLDSGEFDALVLAEAGLERLELAHRISCRLGPPIVYPAVGQAALGLECRAADDDVRGLLEAITDRATAACVRAERALLASLRAGCHAPVGVVADVDGESLTVEAVVLDPEGSDRLVANETGSTHEPEAVGQRLAIRLLASGAARLLGG